MNSAMQRKDAVRRAAVPAGQRPLPNRKPSDDALRLVVRTDGGVALLPLNEIEYLEADGNLVAVHTPTQSYRIRLPLSDLLDRLGGAGFIRIHRCTVVRAAAIVAVEKGEYRKALAVLRSGARLEIGRAEFNRLRELWHPGLLDLDELTITIRALDAVLAG